MGASPSQHAEGSDGESDDDDNIIKIQNTSFTVSSISPFNT